MGGPRLETGLGQWYTFIPGNIASQGNTRGHPCMLIDTKGAVKAIHLQTPNRM